MNIIKEKGDVNLQYLLGLSNENYYNLGSVEDKIGEKICPIDAMHPKPRKYEDRIQEIPAGVKNGKSVLVSFLSRKEGLYGVDDCFNIREDDIKMISAQETNVVVKKHVTFSELTHLDKALLNIKVGDVLPSDTLLICKATNKGRSVEFAVIVRGLNQGSRKVSLKGNYLVFMPYSATLMGRLVKARDHANLKEQAYSDPSGITFNTTILVGVSKK